MIFFLKNTIFSPEVKTFHIFIKLAHKNGWRFINRHVFCQPTHFVRGQAQCSLNTFNEYMSLLLSSKIVFFMYIVILSIQFKNLNLFIISKLNKGKFYNQMILKLFLLDYFVALLLVMTVFYVFNPLKVIARKTLVFRGNLYIIQKISS